MKIFFYILVIAAMLVACSNGPKTINSVDKATDTDYQHKLYETKKYYPFDNWRENYSHGLVQYTQANCDATKKIFDDLIDGLIAIGKDAGEEQKIDLFKKAILATNALDEATGHTLIETGERDELCGLTNQISIACGLDPKKYGSGEGLATEWRDW